MDEKTLVTLEFPKVLERLAAYAAFSISAEMARALRPTSDLEEALKRQARTSEARRLLSINVDFSVGGARDIRALVDLARRAGVLEGSDLLDVKNTLTAARNMARTFERHAPECPHLAEVAVGLPPPSGIIDIITQSISDRGDVLDSASDRLSTIRRELKISHERLMSRLERMINDPNVSPMLQEAIITQRNGRYVLPLRAEFKGRVRSIIHDQSASGATLFVEPLVTVELNNKLHEMQLAERDEVRRILADISAQIGRQAREIETVLGALAEMDLALMCAKYADDLRASEPVLNAAKPRRDHPGTTLRLFQARHPLLDAKKVVSIDVDLNEQTFAVVITGPNTGGKTVTLKTVGLLALMAQSGLHIPAQSGSALSIFADIFADIGDEQSIEQSLSTFSGHITNIVRILGQAGPGTLVLLDELGAGTDPQEGAALARALLSDLVQKRVPCLVATHYPELKSFAHGTPGVVNASMEFDLQTLRPTYHLTLGLPGRSNALLIAERLGLPERILLEARGQLNPEDLRAENLLEEIHQQRDLARQARSAAEKSRGDAERLRSELLQQREQIEDERLKILEKTRREAEKEVEALRREMEDLRRQLNRARQPLEALKPLQRKLTDLEDSVQKPVERQTVAEAVTSRQPLRIGEKVRLRALQMDGVVTGVSESDVEVQLGALRLRTRLSDIQRGGETPPAPPRPTAGRGAARPPAAPSSGRVPAPPLPSPGMELDLRGQRAEDALEMLQTYIDNAYMTGMPFVRIIHGKGTGRLRQVVREALQSSSYVARFETGQESEGGDGVTVAHMKED